jgi:integrase
MAPSMRNAALETRTQRLKLRPGKTYHWVRLGYGLGLGYRRNVSGSGTWSLRIARGGNRGHWIKLIGSADDYDTANGDSVLDCWQASDKARTLGLKARQGDDGAGKLATVAEAVTAYEESLKLRGADIGNVGRIRFHLPPSLAGKSVATLAARDFKPWRAALTKAGLAAASANRSSSVLKAALNYAAAHDERIGNARAWESGLASIPDAVEARNIILDEPTIRAVVTGAYRVSAEFGLLTETAATSGARISQLSRLEVRDLQAARSDPRLMMPSSKKGRGTKKIERRPVPIPASLAVRLLAAVNGRAADAALLVKPSGEPWKKSDHLRLFRRAVELAELDIAAVGSIYSLRHSSIVRQILTGTALRLIAVAHDTSTHMIEKVYSRHIADVSDVPLRRGLLDLAAPADAKVVPLVRS